MTSSCSLCGVELLAVVHEVEPVAIEDGLAAAGYAYDVELEAVALLQLLVLRAYLLNQVASHGAHSADEEVEHLVF